MEDDGTSAPKLRASVYAELAQHLRLKAQAATSSEVRAEYARLAAQYERLAARATSAADARPDAPPLKRYSGLARLPMYEGYFPSTQECVSTRVPQASGIYVLWNRDVWIYVGVSDDIQGRLLQHLAGDNNCITQGRPTAFGFELVDDPNEREARATALIRDLMPIC